MTYQLIQVEEHDGVLIITLDDPKTRNAIGPEMYAEISAELDRFEADANLRCLVITGRDPAFCSGANVRGMARTVEEREAVRGRPELAARPWDEIERRLKETPAESPGFYDVRNLPVRLHRLQKPSIAAVNGYAMGLGLGVALSCDIRIASERASLSETFIQRGLIPADGSCWQLPRMVGLSHTFYMQYTGDIIDPETALRIGLVSRVVPHERLMEEALGLAKRLASGPTYAMGLIKWLVHYSLHSTFEESMRVAGVIQEVARDTHDHREGVQAFLEKRPPKFIGR